LWDGQPVSAGSLRVKVGAVDARRLMSIWQKHDKNFVLRNVDSIECRLIVLVGLPRNDPGFYDTAVESLTTPIGNSALSLLGRGDRFATALLSKCIAAGATVAVRLLGEHGWTPQDDMLFEPGLTPEMAAALLAARFCNPPASAHYSFDPALIGQMARAAIKHGNLELLRFLNAIGADFAAAGLPTAPICDCIEKMTAAQREADRIRRLESKDIGAVIACSLRSAALAKKAADLRASVVYTLRQTNILAPGAARMRRRLSNLNEIRQAVAMSRDTEITDAMRSADRGYDDWLETVDLDCRLERALH
jgi:hypothetical protein